MAKPPVIGRPEPAGYFMKAEEGPGLLPWQHVVDGMTKARNYWIATTGDKRPHAMPVWGVWLGDEFVFSTGPTTRKGRNLKENPYAVVHLESAEGLVLVEGPCRELRDRDDLERFLTAYNPKYSWDFTLEQVSRGVYAVAPRKAFAWLGDEGEAFAGTATRWVFEE